MSSHLTIVAPKWEREKTSSIGSAVSAGRTIYLAGQGPVDPDGKIVGIGDLAAQTERCFLNIEDILARAGSSMNDVVKMTTYFTCPLTREVAQQYWTVRNKFFGTHKPASTGVQVSALLDPEWILEIEVIAVLGEETA